MKRLKLILIGSVAVWLLAAAAARAGEADLAIPDLYQNGAKHYNLPGPLANAWWLLFCGACVIAGTLGISRINKEANIFAQGWPAGT